MKHLLGDFERIVILKSILFEIDENFLSLYQLEHIKEIAYDLEIENFPRYDLEDLYAEDNRLYLVYDNYIKFTIKEYEKIKREIENLIGGN